MNEHTPEERFEWLDAGCAMGDLTPEEEAEWKALADSLGEAVREEGDVSFDAIVSSLEQGLSPEVAMPDGLADQVREGAKEFEKPELRAVPEDPDPVIVRPSFWTRPALGWAAAACLGLLLVVQGTRGPDGDAPDPSGIAALVGQDPGAVRLKFAKTGAGGGVAGEVLWSDAQQQGVMLLDGLAANEPTKTQYQLWVVDSKRDDTHPVDGGVFDIPAGASGVVAIPIDAKLRIESPAAFVITVEQPGGVVVSKQEQVVAVAKS